jgi:hypothetical protein
MEDDSMKTQCVSLSLLCALTMAHSETIARTLTVNNTTDSGFVLYYGPAVATVGHAYLEHKYAGNVNPGEKKVVSMVRKEDCILKVNIEGDEGTFKDQAAFWIPKTPANVKCSGQAQDVNLTIKAVNGRVVIEE